MATLVARQGRHRQLYEDNRRLVSGCIPYRLRDGCEDCECNKEDSLEVLMVSSPNRHDLVFPKGGWENDETVHEAACREAFEEAGVKGNLNVRLCLIRLPRKFTSLAPPELFENTTQLGVWEFRSKSRQAISSIEGGCRGYMFALEVTEEFETWPEQENHGRQWLNIREAFRLCRYEWMREALRAFLELMDTDRQQPKTTSSQLGRDPNVTLAAALMPDRQVAKTTPANRPLNSTAVIAIAFTIVAP
uniref:Nudix hydrolase domain-containing protein n=1 Tax=Chenopodium quinoa TaxID=63459 RepID=A0A803LR99_CHEQI